MADNNFKSFGCFPLIFQGKVLGTISLYTGYEYDFHSSCQTFLDKVTSVVAAFMQRVNESKTVDKVYSVLKELAGQPVDLATVEIRIDPPDSKIREQLGKWQHLIQEKINSDQEKIDNARKQLESVLTLSTPEGEIDLKDDALD